MQENSIVFSVLKLRILQYLDIKNVTRYRFYKESGVTRGILDQKNGISEENLLKFLAWAPSVNTEWLFRGVGEVEKAADYSGGGSGNEDVQERTAVYTNQRGEINRLIQECNVKGNRIIQHLDEIESLKKEIERLKLKAKAKID